MRIERHETRGDYEPDLVQDQRGPLLATIEPATLAEIHEVLKASEDDPDGRSNWCWIRLANGDLILGTFPQGDTYEYVNQSLIQGRV